MNKNNKSCSSCIHFGKLLPAKTSLCLAPITTEPPINGVTKAKNRFVYKTTVNGICELWTPENP